MHVCVYTQLHVAYVCINLVHAYLCINVWLLLPQMVTTLNILSTIANAMGSNCVKYVKVLMPGTIGVLSDSKVCMQYSV